VHGRFPGEKGRVDEKKAGKSGGASAAEEKTPRERFEGAKKKTGKWQMNGSCT